MSRQQAVLAHLGSALLSAQIVQRFFAPMLELPDEMREEAEEGILEAFAAKAKPARLKALAQMLHALRQGDGRCLNSILSCEDFLKERNKSIHCFQALGRRNLENDRDCDDCVIFLRGFIDRAASLQHLFVSALSVREVQYRTSNAKDDANRYANDYTTVYLPLSIRWATRVGA